MVFLEMIFLMILDHHSLEILLIEDLYSKHQGDLPHLPDLVRPDLVTLSQRIFIIQLHAMVFFVLLLI